MGFQLLDPEVVLTDVIKKHLEMGLKIIDNFSAEERKNLKKYSKKLKSDGEITIPFKTVSCLHKTLREHETTLKECDDDLSLCQYLHELLEGSTLHIPELPKPTRSPELEARCQKLRWEQHEKEYQQMVSAVSQGTLSRESDLSSEVGKAVKSAQAGLIVVFNFALTVVASFFFGFFATRYSLTVSNVAAEVLVGMVLATIVAFADLYFIIKSDL